MDKDKLIVVLLLFVFALFLFHQGFFKLAIITPGGEIDAKISYIKIKSTSKPIYPEDQYGTINYFWVNYLENEVFDKEIKPENKPRYASLWDFESGNYYISAKIDPDGEAFGLANLDFRMDYSGSATYEQLVETTCGDVFQQYTTTSTKLIGEFTIMITFGIQADTDWLHGNTEEQSYYDAEIGIEITSYKHPIEEAIYDGKQIWLNYLQDKKHAQVFIPVTKQIASKVRVTEVSFLVLKLAADVILEPTTSLTIPTITAPAETYTVPTTVVVVKTVTETIRYVISGGTIIQTEVVTIPTTYTRLGTAIITIDKPTTVTITKVITTTTGGFTIPNLEEIPPSVLIIGVGVAIVIIAYLLKRRE
jgi:hypothetical protein